MSPAPSLPIVAIVGRPNVGKSTLFNRYAGHRRAVVEGEPGVTRDRIAEEIDVNGRGVLLVDTAGLDPAAEEGLPSAIQAQARSAVSDADAILFVVDGKHGLIPEDQTLARMLRKSAKPISLVVNKIDDPGHAPRTGEFHKLGFDRIRPVSAEHGIGAWDALEELVNELPQETGVAADEAGDGIRVAVVGRPNVGKSSLVNRLLGADRIVVSEVPGTTRDSIDARVERDGDTFTLVDTAGLRRPGRRNATVERVSALMTVRSLERAHVALVVVDASEGLTDQDAHIARLAQDRGRATLVVANKKDLLAAKREKTGESRAAQTERIRDEIHHGLRFLSDGPLLFTSAKTGASVERIFSQVRELAETSRREIPTAELNRWLRDAVGRHEPAMAQRGMRRRPLKFFYATQIGVSPPTFVLFCTEPSAVQTSYVRFLENRLRERFDFRGTPIKLRLRKRSEKR